MAAGPRKTAPAAFIETPAEEAAPPSVAAFESEAAKTAETFTIVETPVAALSQLQGNLRAVAEKGLTQTRAAFSKAKTNADEATSALETSYAAAKAGVLAINAKAFEALRVNADANFDFFKAAFAVKNVADYVALQSEFARKQIEAVTGQSKEIGALTQKLAAETAEPIKEQVAKTFNIAV
jgi:phasin